MPAPSPVVLFVADAAAVDHAAVDVFGRAHDLIARHAFDVADEADAAAVVFESGIVQAARARHPERQARLAVCSVCDWSLRFSVKPEQDGQGGPCLRPRTKTEIPNVIAAARRQSDRRMYHSSLQCQPTRHRPTAREPPVHVKPQVRLVLCLVEGFRQPWSATTRGRFTISKSIWRIKPMLQRDNSLQATLPSDSRCDAIPVAVQVVEAERVVQRARRLCSPRRLAGRRAGRRRCDPTRAAIRPARARDPPPRVRVRHDVEEPDEFAFEHRDAARDGRSALRDDTPKTCSVRMPDSNSACNCCPAGRNVRGAWHTRRASHREATSEKCACLTANEVPSRSRTSTRVGSTRVIAALLEQRIERCRLHRPSSAGRSSSVARANRGSRSSGSFRARSCCDGYSGTIEFARLVKPRAEAQHPTVEQRLLQRGPRIQRRFLDAAAERWIDHRAMLAASDARAR